MALLGVWIVLSNLPLIGIGLLMVGLGIGLNEGTSIQRITIHSQPELQGSSGGLIFTVMNVGCVLGVALFSVAATTSLGSADVYTPAGVAIARAAGFAVAVIALVT